MSWRHHRDPFLGPIKVPPKALFHVGSVKREDGRVLRMVRLLDPHQGVLLIEDPMDQTFDCSMVEIQPMPVPEGGIFYLDYKYGE